MHNIIYELDLVHSDHDSFVCQYPNSGFCKRKRIIIFSQLGKNNNILKIGLGLAVRLWSWKNNLKRDFGRLSSDSNFTDKSPNCKY